jgi:hypothetical protein
VETPAGRGAAHDLLRRNAADPALRGSMVSPQRRCRRIGMKQPSAALLRRNRNGVDGPATGISFAKYS